MRQRQILDYQSMRLTAENLNSFIGEVAKRIDIFATAIFHNMKVEELTQLNLSYTPPLNSY
ncbi:MAG: hypothetical protein AAF915_24035 [Cyanobacteria bacterium P01_D01_bin.50]